MHDAHDGIRRQVAIGVICGDRVCRLRCVELEVGRRVKRLDQHHADAEVAHLVVQRSDMPSTACLDAEYNPMYAAGKAMKGLCN